MCPPDYFEVLYEINPWMHREIVADVDRAKEEWDNLVAILRAAGAVVETLPPEEGWPDLVFTANAGVANGRQFIPSRFRHPERQGETTHDAAWFASHGYEVAELPLGVCQ